MLILESQAKVILVDSGGIQKEAYMFHIPYIILRDGTQQIKTIETKWSGLVGAPDSQGILNAVLETKEPNTIRIFW